MHKIVHENFELDLRSYGLSFVEENYWFTEQFFSKYSFPFSFFLTEELLPVFDYFLDDNNIFLQTQFNVTYYLGNQKEAAVFEIESQVGLDLEATVRFGLEELPNWNKKLAELPLEEAEVEDIYAHAKTIISQTWPDVNYNYPRIYTDKYAEDTSMNFLTGILNNYNGSVFLENTASATEVLNLNILQPTAYLLHILKQGFLDAGYTLQGNFLDDEKAKKTIVFADIDYFDFFKQEAHTPSFTHYNPNPTFIDLGWTLSYYVWRAEFQLIKNSKYKINGNAYFIGGRSYFGFDFKYKNTVIVERYSNASEATPTIGYITIPIDVTFYTDSDNDQSLQQLDFYLASYTMQNAPKILEATIMRITESGEEYPAQLDVISRVNLKEVVPDVTFGKLITEVRKQYNVGIDPVGSDIYMNFLENEMNYNDAIDLSDFEVLTPKKEFNRLDSFLLKYTAPSNEDFSYLPVFQNKDLILNDETNVNDLTEKLEIDILPLPQKASALGIHHSAFSFDLGGASKIYIALYNGLTSGLNLTQDPAPILIPNLHSLHYYKWFSFRLNAVRYNWMFKMYIEQLSPIAKKVYAYGRYHLIKTIEKTQVSDDLFEVEIETETLE